MSVNPVTVPPPPIANPNRNMAHAPKQPNNDTVSDVFSHSGSVSANNSVFQKYGVTPSVAESPQDIVSAGKLYQQTLSDRNIEAMRIAMTRRTDKELISMVKQMGIVPSQLPDILISPLIDQVKVPLKDPEQFKKMIRAEMESEEQSVLALKQRFVDNPQGVLIILKNKEGQVIGMQGLNQFQSTEDFHILQGKMDPLVKNPKHAKHALISKSFIHPDYRKPELEQALHQRVLKEAKDLKYQYSHWPVEKSAAGIIDPLHKELGYQLLKPETVLENSPVFTPKQIKTLMAEYNSDLQELHWKNLLSQVIKAKL